MSNYKIAGPQIAVRGVRQSLPSNYILGRMSQGNGPAELISISSLGQAMQQSGQSVTYLSQLKDVTLGSLSDKQVLRYNNALGKWVNATENLADLGDVNTTGLGTGQLLQFNGTVWAPWTLTYTLNGATDVAISSPSNGQVLTYNSATGKWYNANATGGSTTLAGLTDVQLTGLADGQLLQYNAASSKWKNIATVNGSKYTGISPANKTLAIGSTNGTGMLGFGVSFTPTNSTTVMVVFQTALQSSATSLLEGSIYFGTGTPPANGAASTGTPITLAPPAYNFAPSTFQSYPLVAVVTGLTIGTTYWFDILGFSSNPATMTFANNSFVFVELPTGIAGGGSATLAGDTDVAVSLPANNDLLVYNSSTSKWTNQRGQDFGPMVKPPAVSSLTTRLNGGALADSTFGFTITNTLTSTNTNALAYAVTPIVRGATGKFDFIIRLRRYFGLYNWVMPGMILRDGVGGSSLLMSMGSDSVTGYNKNHFTNDTTWLAVFGAFAMGNDTRTDWWMKLTDDNTNRTWYHSENGVDWQQIYTEAKSVFASSATQVGVHINPNAGGTGNGTVQGKNVVLECLSWQLVSY